MENLSLSISIPGIIAFLLAMVPNFAYMLLAPREEIEKDRTTSHMNGEELSRDFFAFFLVAFTSAERGSIWFLVVAAIFLLLYYTTWLRYFMRGKKEEDLLSPLYFIPLPLAVFPVLYFAFVSLYLDNYLSLVLCILFAFFHIKNSLKKKKAMDEVKK